MIEQLGPLSFPAATDRNRPVSADYVPGFAGGCWLDPDSAIKFRIPAYFSRNGLDTYLRNLLQKGFKIGSYRFQKEQKSNRQDSKNSKDLEDHEEKNALKAVRLKAKRLDLEPIAKLIPEFRG